MADEQIEATGIRWNRDAVPFSALPAVGVDAALESHHSRLVEFVRDAAELEGNRLSTNEIARLVRRTPSGTLTFDEVQVISLTDAFTRLGSLVRDRQFTLGKRTSDWLHAIVAEYEAIESGNFRGEGYVDGGGHVSLGDAGSYRASSPGAGGETLIDEHRRLMAHLDTLYDPREQALAYFCAAARRQFYFDGNKRTARLMMNGHLMVHGYDAISIRAARSAEFNEHLIALFNTGDATALMRFTIDCRTQGGQ